MRNGGLLRQQGFRCYFLARALSRAGDVAFPIGLTAAMLEVGYGTTEVGIVLGVSLAPAVLLMLIGGVLADRLSPRRLMLSADVIRFSAQGILAALFFIGRPSLAEMTVLALVCGVAQALFQPGVASLVRQLVPDRLREGNALVRTAESVMTLTSPALASLLLALFGATPVIVLDAVTFGVSAVLLARIRTLSTVSVPLGRPGIWKDLVQGWREFSSRPWLWSVISVFSLFGLLVFGPFDVLKAVMLTERFGAPAYGLLMSAQGLGSIAGGLLAFRLRPAKPLRAGALALLGFSLLPAAIGLAAPLWVIAAAMVVGGTGLAFWAVMWATAVQTHSPVEALSRIHAYDVVGSTAFTPLGRGLAGPAAALAGTAAVLVGASVLAAAGCLILLSLAAVRSLPSVKPKEAAPPAVEHA